MKKHILAIDDEPDIRDLLTEFLSVKGYRVSATGSSDEALRIAREDPPQLVISDLQMEDTDGLVLIDQIKEIRSEVPVLLLTGVVFDTEVVRETIAKKVTSYLDKTTPLQRILQEVRRLLGDTQT